MLRVRLLRPDDLVNLQIEAVNLVLDTTDASAPRLAVDDVATAAYLVVEFPPQAIVEEAVFVAGGPGPAPGDKTMPEPRATSRPGPTRPLRSRISGTSRLVFSVPPEQTIPFTVAGLLDWTALQLRVSPLAALPPSPTEEEIAAAPGVAAPEPDVTAIELPYRLLLSPSGEAAWTHSTSARTTSGRTELWHTRLSHLLPESAPVPTSAASPAPLRAVWSPDFPSPPAMGEPDPDWDDPPGVLTAMTPRDRHEIVALTSAFSGYVEQPDPADPHAHTLFVPTPIAAEQLILSALGGWLKSRGHWDPPREWIQIDHGPLTHVGHVGRSLNISEWVHAATSGRDHYVRIVYEGYLYPFRHRAALVKVTERRIAVGDDGSPVAFLAQRMFVVVREPLRNYRTDAEEGRYGRANPLRQVRLTTLITPDILPPHDAPQRIPNTTYSFWVTVPDGRFRFHAVGEDAAGQSVDLTSVMIFVPFVDFTPAAVAQVRAAYLQGGTDRASYVPGQHVRFAEPDPGGADNTTLVTSELHFTTEDTNAGDPDTYSFRPTLLKAAVRLPAVEQLLGTNTATEIGYVADFLADGFTDPAKTGVFAQIAAEPAAGEIIQATLGATFAADQAGGVATPNLSISGLTRRLGPVAGADLTKLDAGTFDPAEFFADVKDSVKLFGTFSLLAILLDGTLDDQAPTVQLSTEALSPTSRKLVATLDWAPRVHSATVGIVSFVAEAGTAFAVNGRVERVVELTASAAPPAARSEFAGRLAHFTIDLLGVVGVHFVSFGFTSRSGTKPEVSIALADVPVSFEGDLAFVNELQKWVPPDLFGGGASLDVNATRIRAGFAIGLPSIAIGVFSLEGVTLAASVELPFADGKPLFDFGVSSREHPFCLTVAFLGGGGFFHLQLDTGGIRRLEAALEFGASASINLGVASGGVHILAGIYFAMGTKDGHDYSILSGFLRMGGELSVLGLVSISLEFVLSFGYEDGKAAGRATLTVKVEIAFFSKSVSISVEKKFGGSSGDPRFADVFTPAIWDDYASAFA